MISNQIEFNIKYNAKESKEIKIKDVDFQGQLVIEGYSELEKLYLQEVDNIDKLTLKNLTQLQEVTIWDCSTKELVIENCPQIKKLIARSNLLISLEFAKDLKSLEELDLYGNIEINSGLEHLSSSLKTFSYENTKLTEILKPYKGNWKECKENIKEALEISKNPYQLAKVIHNLKEENKKLKEKQPVIIDNSEDFQKKYQKLKGTLNFLLKEEELKSKEINILKTEELTNALENKLKGQVENLSKLQQANQELQEKLSVYEEARDKIKQKEQELAELKNDILVNKPEIKDNLEELLEAQRENSSKWLERIKNRLVKQITLEEINNLCQRQEVIIKLQSNINQREQQIYQIINNINAINVQQGHVLIGNQIGDKADFSYNNTQVENKIEIPLK